jgi:hypothetical protein
VQYRDYKLDRGTKTFEILYGPQSGEWEGDKDIDTIYQKQVFKVNRPMVLKVNDYEYADNGSTQKDLDRSSVDAEKNIQLTPVLLLTYPSPSQTYDIFLVWKKLLQIALKSRPNS